MKSFYPQILYSVVSGLAAGAAALLSAGAAAGAAALLSAGAAALLSAGLAAGAGAAGAAALLSAGLAAGAGAAAAKCFKDPYKWDFFSLFLLSLWWPLLECSPFFPFPFPFPLLLSQPKLAKSTLITLIVNFNSL